MCDQWDVAAHHVVVFQTESMIKYNAVIPATSRENPNRKPNNCCLHRSHYLALIPNTGWMVIIVSQRRPALLCDFDSAGVFSLLKHHRELTKKQNNVAFCRGVKCALTMQKSKYAQHLQPLQKTNGNEWAGRALWFLHFKIRTAFWKWITRLRKTVWFALNGCGGRHFSEHFYY